MNNASTTVLPANILVVDDDLGNLRMLAMVLDRHGYTVRTIPEGRLALTSVRAELPDLILLDVMMPDMDGYEVCTQLKADERTRDIPVIFISGATEVFNKVRAFSVGGVDYITKPFHVKEVLARVGTHLALWAMQKRLEEKNVQLEHEITERLRTEEQLQRYAAELEQSNEEIRQFAYIVSHDLRAPLTNLEGYAAELGSALELIGSALSTALPHLDEKQRPAVATALQEDVPEALGFIDSSVTRMDRFTNALLKLSRLGRRELYFEPIDMNALVQETLQSLAHQIEERQVKVTVGPLPEVIADRTSIEQIMGNILDNAVKYLDPGRPGEIEISGERGRDETTFRVCDNGRGIEEEDMDKVFAPFRRAGRQDVPGEGMGLPYVQALVRRHSGRLGCESELGVRTTFTFTLSNHLCVSLQRDRR